MHPDVIDKIFECDSIISEGATQPRIRIGPDSRKHPLGLLIQGIHFRMLEACDRSIQLPCKGFPVLKIGLGAPCLNEGRGSHLDLFETLVRHCLSTRPESFVIGLHFPQLIGGVRHATFFVDQAMMGWAQEDQVPIRVDLFAGVIVAATRSIGAPGNDVSFLAHWNPRSMQSAGTPIEEVNRELQSTIRECAIIRRTRPQRLPGCHADRHSTPSILSLKNGLTEQNTAIDHCNPRANRKENLAREALMSKVSTSRMDFRDICAAWWVTFPPALCASSR
ncbi:hypothetical protein SAMN02787144_1001607 [Streptomyces atratus]|uniref:Uncharacterized protein n=1 Tax=Streptomyces atratus TaxID=1893 RepID=A0A1K1UJV4_STRAR|nr:hypothetical protein SAMN02787144_1001607 [Streptomyces atratus]